MIQCALNGAYTAADHPAVPVTLEQIVADARACAAAGAASVHFHPHRPEGGGDSMAADVLDPVVAAVRAAVPQLELALVNLQAGRYTQTVNVYQAMGGGWVELADARTPRPAGSAATGTP